jgi:hypothetical protein
MFGLAIVHPWGRRVPDLLLVGVNAVFASLLLAWGGANVVGGSLSLAGVTQRS